MICTHRCPHRPFKLTSVAQARRLVIQYDDQTVNPFPSVEYSLSVAFHESPSSCNVFLHTQEVAGSSPAAPTITTIDSKRLKSVILRSAESPLGLPRGRTRRLADHEREILCFRAGNSDLG